MTSNPSRFKAGAELAGATRKTWVKPAITRIHAGSAEAVSRDGQPDGGGVGQSRS